ncbi:MAG: hypothetical protein WCD18_11040 [Thermosynechococcaceae cyanobacterium]
MTTEQLLLEKWRLLPQDKQQQVLDLIETFYGEEKSQDPVAFYEPKTVLGKRLKEIRAEIIASGEPLLDWEGIAYEKAERRGGYQGDNE